MIHHKLNITSHNLINTIDCDLIGLGIGLIELKLLLKQLIDIDLQSEQNRQTISNVELYEFEMLEHAILNIWNDSILIHNESIKKILSELKLCNDCGLPFNAINDDVCFLFCDDCCFSFDGID